MKMNIEEKSTTSYASLKCTFLCPPPPSLPYSVPSSSSSSSLPSNSALPTITITQARGLDLLIKAVILVEGNDRFGEDLNNSNKTKRHEEELGLQKNIGRIKRRRHLTMPVKFQDSVLQPWKRQTRPRH